MTTYSPYSSPRILKNNHRKPQSPDNEPGDAGLRRGLLRRERPGLLSREAPVVALGDDHITAYPNGLAQSTLSHAEQLGGLRVAVLCGKFC